MTELTPQSAENKIRFNQTRKAILQKRYQLCKENPELDEEEVLERMEQETASLFDQVHAIYQPTDSEVYFKPHDRPRKRLLARTEHVGRFFIHSIEHRLQLMDMPPCVIPVLAHSVSRIIGDEAYNLLSGKINHLIMFADASNYGYDEMLESEPGREITREIMGLYRDEIRNNPSLEETLTRQLESALTEYASLHPEAGLDVEQSIEKSTRAFVQLIQENPINIHS